MFKNIIIQECTFKAVRSSGAGGQHVNKVSSKIELSFDLWNSKGLSDKEKQRIAKKLAHRLTNNGILQLNCSESRSQHKNKELVIKRFLALLNSAIILPKKRIKTKIPKSVIRKRLKNKSFRSDIKKTRKKPNLD